MADDDDETQKIVPIPMTERWALDNYPGMWETREVPDSEETETAEEAALIDSWLEETDEELDQRIDELLAEEDEDQSLTKHLPGKHEQKDHGHDEESFAPSEEEWSELSGRTVRPDEFDRKDQANKSHFYRQWSSDVAAQTNEYQHEAVDSYIDGEYRAINARLRGYKVSPSQRNLNLLIRDLDSSFEVSTAVCPENLLAFRGITIDPDFGKTDRDAYEFYRGLSVGDVFEDKGYFSSSLSEGTAREFTTGSPAYVMFEIEVPEGSRALPTSGFASDISKVSDERELLFPRKTKFEVIQKESDGSIDGVHDSWYIKLRLRHE
jgi:hypothetical protein